MRKPTTATAAPHDLGRKGKVVKGGLRSVVASRLLAEEVGRIGEPSGRLLRVKNDGLRLYR
jgi:hypothetical protein